jgi:hypothetical protein
LSFNWFGHQSRFDVPPLAVGLFTGHLLSSLIRLPPGNTVRVGDKRLRIGSVRKTDSQIG